METPRSRRSKEPQVGYEARIECVDSRDTEKEALTEEGECINKGHKEEGKKKSKHMQIYTGRCGDSTVHSFFFLPF